MLQLKSVVVFLSLLFAGTETLAFHAIPQPLKGVALSDLFQHYTPNKLGPPPSVTAQYTFRGAQDDSINYVQLCYTTDNQCNDCNNAFSTITSGAPLPYTTGGTSYRIGLGAISAYLHNGQFGASLLPNANYYVGLYVKSTSLICNDNTSYCSSILGDSFGEHLCIHAITNGSGDITLVSQNDNGSVTLGAQTDQYVYVTNTSSLELPGVYLCALSTDGTLLGCSTASMGTYFGTNPGNITITTVQGMQYAYIVDNASQRIIKCGLANDGSFLGCSNSGTGDDPDPKQVAFTSFSGVQYAYIADGDNAEQGIYQCTLSTNNDGAFSSCTKMPITSGALNSPIGITFATFNGTQYAYIPTTGGLYICSVTPDGTTLDTCNVQNPTGLIDDSWTPVNVTFARFNNTQYAYVADSSGHVYQCLPSEGGAAVNTCVDTNGGATFSTPHSITFVTTDGTEYAYVAAEDSNNVFKCSLNVTNGLLAICNPTDEAAGMTAPYGITSTFFNITS
jgi:hypothetical protein